MSTKRTKRLTHIKLYQYLRDINATQSQFAEYLGTTQFTISALLSGKRKPSPKFLELLSKKTDGYFTFEDFYGENAKYALI